MLTIVLVLLFVPNVISLSCPYECEVTDFFNSERVSWRKKATFSWPRHETAANMPPSRELLELTTPSSDRPPVLLHLLTSPTCSEECVSPILTKKMTDSSALPIIHLHQDVWRAKRNIVCNRLLMRLGRTNSRIFARKTTAKRINTDVARSFLEEHHLWSATKAKHNYGLFDGEKELVAVATFSKGRTVLRGGVPHQSHELLRFCSKQDGTVVGGITKLIKAFVREQKPDDIVTVVDRDWGPGSGWHALGFEAVHAMPPLVMAVKDGERRHLVGAGIQKYSDTKKTSAGRLGLTADVLGELASIDDVSKARNCLARHGFYPVYDTGVERLMMVVPDSDAASVKEGDCDRSSVELWKHSVPTYAASYYSNNSGIAALLGDIEQMDKSFDELDLPAEIVRQVLSSRRKYQKQ